MEGFDEEEEDIINTEETNYCRSIGKKKRLSMDQVQGLEKIFEVDSKLDQERKVKLAAELGLQPRQVAIWFQNRRARWKTKQLERDFRLLKANYESLQQNYSQIEREKEGLVAEVIDPFQLLLFSFSLKKHHIIFTYKLFLISGLLLLLFGFFYFIILVSVIIKFLNFFT